MLWNLRIILSQLHAHGYRYRLHSKHLPGRPDLVFPSRRRVVFVHGCFWHRHPGCRYATMPKTRIEFWNDKFEANVKRDARQIVELDDLGWSSMIVWECETKAPDAVLARLCAFLDDVEGEGGKS